MSYWVDWERIGDYVKDRRKDLGLDKSEAAARAGVSKRTWEDIEDGDDPNLSDATLIRVAKAMRLDPEALLRRCGRKARPAKAAAGPGDAPTREAAERALREAEGQLAAALAAQEAARHEAAEARIAAEVAAERLRSMEALHALTVQQFEAERARADQADEACRALEQALVTSRS
jgi:transcriptional regulator with XRE-family HTH domain